MVKRHITLTIDNGIVEKLRAKGLNISKEVNEFLAQLVGERTPASMEIELLRKEKADLEAQLSVLDQKEKDQIRDQLILKKIEPYREYYRKRLAEGNLRPEWVDESARVIGITVEKFKELIGAKN